MSNDDEWGWYHYRAVLAVGFVFAGLLVYALFDLVFLALGRDGTATVTEVYKLPGTRRSDYWEMEFKYKDAAGHERLGKYKLGATSAGAAAGDSFAIQYLPMWLLDAPDAARPKRPFHWGVFSGLVLVSAAFGVFTYRAIYSGDEGRRSTKRRR